MRAFILASLTALTLAAAPQAQAHPSSAEAMAARGPLELRLPTWFTGPTLKRNGVKLEFNRWGSNYEIIFAGSPEALEHASVYRTKRIAGTTLNAIAMVSLITQAIIVLAAPEVLPSDPTVVNTAWLLSSVGVASIGNIVSSSASSDLNAAVDAYNRRFMPAPGTVKVGWSTRF